MNFSSSKTFALLVAGSTTAVFSFFFLPICCLYYQYDNFIFSMKSQQLYSFGWIFLPILIFLLIKRYYLDKNEMLILLICCGLTASFFIGGWIMQLIHLLFGGLHAMIVMQLCVLEFQEVYRYQDSMENSLLDKSFQKQSHWIIKIKFDEVVVFLVIVAFWVILRIYSTSSYTFGIGQQLYDGTTFQGLLVTLQGWNCTFNQFIILPVFWIAIYAFCWYVIAEAIKLSAEDLVYKLYLLNYMVKPSIINLSIVIIFNLVANFNSDGLLQCYYYWKEGAIFLLFMYWGISIISIVFFILKQGKIELRSNSSSGSKSDVIDMEGVKVIKFRRKNPDQ